MIEARAGQPGAPVPLQQWIESHPAEDERYWTGAAGHQIRFVRDSLLPVFGAGLAPKQAIDAISVISTHRSKSIELPVFQLERPDRDLRVVLRNNFYNWKMSVVSDTPVPAVFGGLFHTTPPVEPDYTGDELHSVYFEGFPPHLVFPYYSQTDGRQWSAEIQTDNALWTSMFLMMRALGVVKPMTWHTRESHRRELNLNK